MLCYVYGQNVIFIVTLKYTPTGLKFGTHIFLTYCNIFKPVEQHLKKNFLKIPFIDGPVEWARWVKKQFKVPKNEN